MSASSPLRLSVLDLSPVPSGSSDAEALHNTIDLARHADQLGFYRYWLSEHHSTALLASATPELLIGYVASATKNIRVGSGGIMLPNHSPLKVAETFRMLEAFHPGRIDLGLGRAPGTDGRTALALRRSREALMADDFPEQLDELIGFLSDEFPLGHPFGRINAIPSGVERPDIWLLGSSDFSARLAAREGLGFAFAHHISSDPAIAALRYYRQQFQPSTLLKTPESILTVSVICAETDEKARELASSAELAILRLHQGQLSPLPSVEEATSYDYTHYEKEAVQAHRGRMFVGSPTTVRTALNRLAEQSGVTEVMVTTLIHDHKARLNSYSLLKEIYEN